MVADFSPGRTVNQPRPPHWVCYGTLRSVSPQMWDNNTSHLLLSAITRCPFHKSGRQNYLPNSWWKSIEWIAETEVIAVCFRISETKHIHADKQPEGEHTHKYSPIWGSHRNIIRTLGCGNHTVSVDLERVSEGWTRQVNVSSSTTRDTSWDLAASYPSLWIGQISATC